MSHAYADILGHAGPWTEDDYLALPDDGLRIELLDGALLVNPPPSGPHQRLSSQLWLALAGAAPDGVEVLEGIGIRVAPNRILIPDLTVVTNPGAALTVWEPYHVALVVEITSLGSVTNDRAVKPELYARAGISHYLRIEPGDRGPVARSYVLGRGGYALAAPPVEPGHPLQLAEPFVVTLDLATFARATRPAR